MASSRFMRDSDTALWLHNKLGSTEELWVSSSIGGIIKTDTIDNIYRCFSVLTTTVKIKLLLGILHLPRRSLEEMKHMIDGLVELALDDMDQWVKLVAKIVKTYPMTCKLNLDVSSNPIAANVVHQLKGKVIDSDIFATLPLECQYVNRNALQSMVGNQNPPRRHFALKRKPKSAALRVDLMQKSTNASSHVKHGNFGNKIVPVKHRDMTRKFSDDASPMRGIPKAPLASQRQESMRNQQMTHSQASTSLNRNFSRFSSRVERATKLLDISEQPIGVKEAKRRKKMQQEEETSQIPVVEEKEDDTPEYAAGLAPPMMSHQPVLPPSTAMDTDDAMSNDGEDTDDQTGETSNPVGYVSADIHDVASEEYDGVNEFDSVPSSSNNRHDDDKLPATEHERRMSMDESLTYAMPATPSPFFKPVNVTPPTRKEAERINQIGIESQKTDPPTGIPFTYDKSSGNGSATKSFGRVMNPDVTSVPSFQSPNNLTISKSGLSTIANAQISHPVPKANPPQSSNFSTIKASTAVPNLVPTYASTLYQPQVVRMPSTPSYIVSPNIVQHQPQIRVQQQSVRIPSGLPPATGTIPVGSHISYASGAMSHPPVQPQFQQGVNLQQQQQTTTTAAPQAIPPKKALSLTREQMFRAQQMFQSANCLSRQEKSIILGFMAGSRDNPWPEKGDVVQILLSQHDQNVQGTSGGAVVPVLVETIFEMNYRTGVSSTKQHIKPMARSNKAMGMNQQVH